MSVRVGDRQQGKFQVLNKARVLKRYTLAVLKNDKYFPKSVRWMYAQPIHQEMRAACSCIRRANASRGDTYYERQRMTEFYNKQEEHFHEQHQLQGTGKS